MALATSSTVSSVQGSTVAAALDFDADAAVGAGRLIVAGPAGTVDEVAALPPPQAAIAPITRAAGSRRRWDIAVSLPSARRRSPGGGRSRTNVARSSLRPRRPALRSGWHVIH